MDNASFAFTLGKGSATTPVLTEALCRYRKLLFPPNLNKGRRVHSTVQQEEAAGGDEEDLVAAAAKLTGCEVVIDSASEDIQLGFDESYVLSVPTSGIATIHAPTVYGALHGLETLTQMVEFDRETARTGVGRISAVPIKITDEPRFKHRGLMLDTARHYLPVAYIRTHIEAMAAAKLNTLHWHLSDIQSFPFQSEVHPKLSEYGAYDPDYAIYTHDNVKGIVQHAKAHGIRVVPEFDTPGHTGSWFRGHPELQGNTKGGAMDPTSEVVYDFLDKLVGELATLFPDDVLHLGCDELPLGLWDTPAIDGWKAAKGINTSAALETYWLERVHDIGKKHGKRITVWHDPLDNGATIGKDAVVEAWNGDSKFANNFAAQGWETIMAAPFYLDATGKQWADFYGVDFPPNKNATIEAKMLGGEACMWSEWVDAPPRDSDPQELSSGPRNICYCESLWKICRLMRPAYHSWGPESRAQVDATNSVNRVWPRAAAVSENLWAPADGSNPLLAQFASKRMAQWRCRMLLRGVSAEPIEGGLLTPDPWCGRQRPRRNYTAVHSRLCSFLQSIL